MQAQAPAPTGTPSCNSYICLSTSSFPSYAIFSLAFVITPIPFHVDAPRNRPRESQRLFSVICSRISNSSTTCHSWACSDHQQRKTAARKDAALSLVLNQGKRLVIWRLTTAPSPTSTASPEADAALLLVLLATTPTQGFSSSTTVQTSLKRSSTHSSSR